MVYVTHDRVEAMTLGDRIAVFNGGRIEQVAPLELVHAPGQPVRRRLPRLAAHELHPARSLRQPDEVQAQGAG